MLILAVGAVRDALFGIVLVSNILIGIVQELRAKFTLDRLSVLSASKARVIRGGQPLEIEVESVVLDDVLELLRGDQVVADGQVLVSRGLEIDESLLTGESEPVNKSAGDTLMSGSFVVAGAGSYQATKVGSQAYARKLTAQARRFKLVHSELRTGINRILAGITWIMIPTGLFLFWRALDLSDFEDSVSGSVAAMVGMIPEGLVLLTSIAFAAAVVVLGRRKVLVQELPAVEGLARVDVVCFDKTGTLTEAGLQFDRLEMLTASAVAGSGAQEEDIAAALGVLAADPSSRNPTMDAVAAAFPAKEKGGETAGRRVPFSSERKWSAVTRGGNRSWIIGAPEIMLTHAAGASDPAAIAAQVQRFAREGRRILLLAAHGGELQGEELPAGLEPRALVLLEEKIRSDAAQTLEYFAAQGVAVKVISGDNPETVAAVVDRVGLTSGEPVDGRDLPDDRNELARIMSQSTVFGRVTAHQKQSMIKALQQNGHVVAMTGDGVNDTLALKEADIGIAVGTGAAAPTKAVAELVLLDGRFATLPGVVAEGRRVIANIERVAYLFVTKTAWATLLAVTIGVLGWPYPFLPRHLTLVGAITIGIPAFFLALAPSKERYRPGFVRRVLHFTIPAGSLLAAGTMVTYALARSAGADLDACRTVATLSLTIMGLCVLVVLARPFTLWRYLMLLAMVAGLVVAMLTPFTREFFVFEFPSTGILLQSLVAAAISITLLVAGLKITGWTPHRGAE